MSIRNLKLQEVEQERERQAIELAADSGKNWADDYRPGTAGCHELVDRAALLEDMLERHIVAHPACVARPEWYRLAHQAATSMHELYQLAAAEHLAAPEPIGHISGASATAKLAHAGDVRSE